MSYAKHNGIRDIFRICKASRTNKSLQAAIYLQDQVFTKIAHLEEGSPVFDADLHYHKTCFEGSLSYLYPFVIPRSRPPEVFLQVCRRRPMPKCDFSKVAMHAMQLY